MRNVRNDRRCYKKKKELILGLEGDSDVSISENTIDWPWEYRRQDSQTSIRILKPRIRGNVVRE